MNCKKILSIIMAGIICLGCSSAWAEESVSVILNAGTTQAFTDEAVPEEDMNIILKSGLSATGVLNQKPWYFAVVTNQDVIEEISSSVNFDGVPMNRPEGKTPENAAGMPEGGVELPNEAVGEGSELPEITEDAGMMPKDITTDRPMVSRTAKAALGDSPVAVIIYMDENTSSLNASFDCGLACQNMVISANALGYGTKILPSSRIALNGEDHDALCEKLGVDTSLTAVAVLLIGIPEAKAEDPTDVSIHSTIDEKVSFVE